ncbi:tetraacyldisaccharide 4'-kinase [Polaromonas sp.]|uniref:tetraacyldisaccharide 4'-kinase n=1 Tax=Polaromonas sp. TaxID=1869339 RepID=UPI001A32BA86|nr:tetraacyldisaccharide 4'-kinase [Burkholderiales bacterium]
MKQVLLKAWRTRGWLACLLWPVAQLHGLLVRLRQTLYRRGLMASERFGVPVIVVGNVVAGGAGKTPLVMALVRHFQAQGLPVGVISRGYGRSGHESLEIRPETPVYASGDEPALIQHATGAPVFVARRRAQALRDLLAAYPATAVVVCDDGLQHYALQRDIEIAVFDDRGVGNGWLLPAGPLREPWPERLRQGIDLVLHTGQKPAFEGYTSRRQLAEHAIAADGTRLALSALAHQPLVALAGIASPEAFFGMLRARGLTLQKTLALPDHHNFTTDDLNALTGQTVLCTEKDAVKLFPLPGHSELKLLAVPLEFSPETAFFTALDARLAPLLSQLPSSHGHQTY